MFINVTWDDPDQTILIYRFNAMWEKADYSEAAQMEWQLMDSVEHRVDIILDLQRLDTLPDDLAAHIWNSAAHSHLHRGLLTLLGDRSITQAFAEVLTDVYPEAKSDILQVATLHAARWAIAIQYGKSPTEPRKPALSVF